MNDLDLLKQAVARSNNIVFFGGAGVSTESNIPDFRSENGIYQVINRYGHAPELMLSHSFFENETAAFYRFYFAEMIYAAAEPNPAHLALAQLEQQGKLKAIITQNIDGLHQKAGSKKVLELHGSVLRNYCLNCGLKYRLDFLLSAQPHVPHCRDCGSIVRPDVVLYEEELPAAVLADAIAYIKKADTLIVGGTSLMVYPAAGLIDYFRGRQLILINQSATAYDTKADLVIRTSIGEALKYALPNA